MLARNTANSDFRLILIISFMVNKVEGRYRCGGMAV